MNWHSFQLSCQKEIRNLWIQVLKLIGEHNNGYSLKHVNDSFLKLIF